MSAKKPQILEQNQDFETILADEYRREAGVADSFATDILKFNRVSTPVPSKKRTGSEGSRKLARRLLLKK